MAYQNGNLAYDISVYEPKVNQPAHREKPKIEVNVKKAPAVRTQSAFGILVGAAVVFAMMFAMLYGKVETNRLFNEATRLEAELKALESENISLAAEYESKTSLRNVEDYAQNVLGLQKLDKSQIQYVEFEGDTVCEVVESEKENIFVIIKNWFANLCEYLGA